MFYSAARRLTVYRILFSQQVGDGLEYLYFTGEKLRLSEGQKLAQGHRQIATAQEPRLLDVNSVFPSTAL